MSQDQCQLEPRWIFHGAEIAEDYNRTLIPGILVFTLKFLLYHVHDLYGAEMPEWSGDGWRLEPRLVTGVTEMGICMS